MLNAARPTSGGQEIVGLLDIGSSKVCCVIAVVEPLQPGQRASAFRVIGFGHQRSRGVKAGVITDLDEAEVAIRAAVSQAERSANVALQEVLVSVACGRLRSTTFAAKAEVESGVVHDADVSRVLAGGRSYAERDGLTLIHMTQIGYRLDGAAGVRDPRGMAARLLSADLHAVTADDAPIRNLLLVVERCHLAVSGLVAAGYASAIAATTSEERTSGVTVIDIGGGSSTIAMFADGHFLHTDSIAVGGNHLTFDIARALTTPLAEAERIKALYGTMVAARSDEHEVVTYPLAGEEDGELHHTTKAELRVLLRPRVDSVLGLLGERIGRAASAPYAGRRVVLTGGASQLVGLAEHAANVLGRPVRIARPQAVAGLPAGLCNPAFSTVVGMLRAAAVRDVAITAYRDRDALGAGYLQRVGRWFKEGF